MKKLSKRKTRKSDKPHPVIYTQLDKEDLNAVQLAGILWWAASVYDIVASAWGMRALQQKNGWVHAAKTYLLPQSIPLRCLTRAVGPVAVSGIKLNGTALGSYRMPRLSLDLAVNVHSALHVMATRNEEEYKTQSLGLCKLVNELHCFREELKKHLTRRLLGNCI